MKRGPTEEEAPPQPSSPTLQATAPCAALGFRDWMDEKQRAGPSIPPTLLTYYCPSKEPAAPEPPPTAADDPFWRFQLGEADDNGPPPNPDRLGSSSASNLKRHGLQGLSQKGRREVRNTCCVLDQYRGCLAFWTVTLPDEALAAIRQNDTWSSFQHRIQSELRRRLRLRGLSGELVGVVEIHPKRSRAAGTPLPHLHVCFRGKKNRWHRWALDRWELDSIISAAAATAGAGRIDARAAGNVQMIKKSVRRYLTKYLTKEQTAPDVPIGEAQLVPRQWWFRSGEALRAVRQQTFQAPWSLINFVHTNRRVLEAAGLVCWRKLDRLPPEAPPCYAIDWLGPDQLAAVLALWQEWQWDVAWQKNCSPLHVSPRPFEYPLQHQLV